MGLQQTGFLDSKVMKIVQQGKCLGKKQKLRLKSAGEDSQRRSDHLRLMLIFQAVSAWVWWTGSEEESAGVCTVATGGAMWLRSQTVHT